MNGCTEPGLDGLEATRRGWTLQEACAGARTIAFHTLGCRVNTADTQNLEHQAMRRGLCIVPFNEQADIYVINTCTVTAQADQQCRKLSRQARARNPEATVVAVGCYVQAQPEAVARLDHLDLVLDNWDKSKLFERLGVDSGFVDEPSTKVTLPMLQSDADDKPSAAEREWVPHSLGRRRAFLKVQDGCDETCSYCIIPRSRGPSRSRPLDDILREVERLLVAGYQELVMVGVHLSEWGRDLFGEASLPALIRRLCQFDDLPSLRVSSLEPEGVTDELVEAFCHPKVCPHLHLPVQSGSARILRAMRRAYEPEDVERALERVARSLPDFGLGSDFILGFPGETAEDFAETLALIERLPFSYLHPFPYSIRPGTDAASYPDQVPDAVRAERVRAVNRLGKAKRAAFVRSRIGRTYRTWLFPGPRGAAHVSDRAASTLRGLTGNYLTVQVQAPSDLVNRFADVRLTGLESGTLLGQLVTT